MSIIKKVNLTEDELSDLFGKVVQSYEIKRLNGTMKIVKSIYGDGFAEPYYEEKERKFYKCGFPFSTQLDDWRLRNLGKVLTDHIKSVRSSPYYEE